MERIIKVIKAAVKKGASDLHIKAGDVIRARIDGELVPLTKQRLSPAQTRAIALHFITNAEDKKVIDKIKDYDCSWGQAGVGRFRINILRQRSSFMVVMRVVPFDMPSFESLALPAVMERVADAERGLILVAGMAGSGKTSTVAAVVNHINQNKHKHIVTIEDPLEFLHRDVNSAVTQREVGVDTDSFYSGIRAALRQDPDVLVIGEMRDAETVETAIRAAEAGNLVISTTHTRDVVSTIDRLVEMFPADDQPVIRARLADAVHAVVALRLVQAADHDGRVPALEVVFGTEETRSVIRNADRVGQLVRIMSEDESGMQTLNQHLATLVKDDAVGRDVALAASDRRSDLEDLLGSEGRSRNRSRGRRRG